MNKAKKFILALPELIFFFSIFIGSVGLIWTIIEILDRFKVDLTYFESLGKLSIYLIVIHSVVVALLAIYFKKVFFPTINDNNPPNPLVEKDTILVQDLTDSLEQGLKAKNYSEVIRIGTALSRPFFESGNYKARLQIGLLVEEAAALNENKPIQMKELIDTIGWSYVELGQLDEGEKHILHGFDLARNLEDNFYISKAQRHLGAINRRKGQFAVAENYYKEAIISANKITEETPKTELVAGINYAQASLYLHQNNYEPALSHINNSIQGFTQLGDDYKLTMAQTSKGTILFLMNKIEDAKDIFRTAIRSSEHRTERLQMARCYIGMTKIYLKESNWTKAKEHLEKATQLKKDIKSASELAEIEQLWTKIPK